VSGLANTYRILPDGSKQPFLTIKQGDGGTTDYNELINRPIVNLSGNITLNTLPNGVYKINGSWSMTTSSDVFSSTADIFIVSAVPGGVTVTRLSGTSVYRITWSSAAPAIVNYDEVAWGNDILNSITGINGGGALLP
jgi:hypothetical protein